MGKSESRDWLLNLRIEPTPRIAAFRLLQHRIASTEPTVFKRFLPMRRKLPLTDPVFRRSRRSSGRRRSRIKRHRDRVMIAWRKVVDVDIDQSLGLLRTRQFI